jgi:hypothetical protein
MSITELEPSGARRPSARASAGADAAAKEELCLCGGHEVARGSIPSRYAARALGACKCTDDIIYSYVHPTGARDAGHQEPRTPQAPQS